MKKNSLLRGLDGGQSLSSMYKEAYDEAGAMQRPRSKLQRRPTLPPQAPAPQMHPRNKNGKV